MNVFFILNFVYCYLGRLLSTLRCHDCHHLTSPLHHLCLPQVDIISESPDGDLSNYQSNGEFDLVDFSAKRNVQNYSCCPEPYPDITYTIRLRRRPMFYVFNLILPCILINGIGERTGTAAMAGWAAVEYFTKSTKNICIGYTLQSYTLQC